MKESTDEGFLLSALYELVQELMDQFDKLQQQQLRIIAILNTEVDKSNDLSAQVEMMKRNQVNYNWRIH